MQSNEYLYYNENLSNTVYVFVDDSPIFKSDDNMNKGNFHPVSILSIQSKLYESVLNEKCLITFVRYLMQYHLHIGDITVRQLSLKIRWRRKICPGQGPPPFGCPMSACELLI